MDEPKHRLQRARAAAGFDSPADAARAHKSLNQNTLTSNENGNRDISRKMAEKYGAAFGVDPGYLLYGDSPDTMREIPLVASVSASTFRARDGVLPTDIAEEDIKRWVRAADLPRGDWMALTIEGDSIDRLGGDGSIALVNRSDQTMVDGRFYVFALAQTGDATIKRYQSNGNLLMPYSTNPAHMARPMEGDVEVVGRVRRVITDV